MCVCLHCPARRQGGKGGCSWRDSCVCVTCHIVCVVRVCVSVGWRGVRECVIAVRVCVSVGWRVRECVIVVRVCVSVGWRGVRECVCLSGGGGSESVCGVLPSGSPSFHPSSHTIS